MFKSFIKFLAVALFSSAVLACGGTSPAEAACTHPSEIIINKTAGFPINKFHRATPTSDLTLAAQNMDATREVFFCNTPGTTQQISFRLNTDMFFGYHGDHIAVMGKAFYNGSVPSYLGRGVILHNTWGVVGERYARNYQGYSNILQCNAGVAGGTCPQGWVPNPKVHPMTMQNNRDYDVVMHAISGSIFYRVTDVATGQVVESAWYENYNHTYIDGSGVVFALLFGIPEDQIVQNVLPFTVRMSNISVFNF